MRPVNTAKLEVQPNIHKSFQYKKLETSLFERNADGLVHDGM